MEHLMNYMDSKGLRTSYLPLLDNPVYYGILDDFDVTFLINPRGLPELIISTAIPENENLKSFSDYLSNIDLKATYHIQSYSITESCMHFKWNFHPDKFNPQDIIAFIDWFFPLLKKYGATPANICTECGRPMNQTNSGWYNISGTAATIPSMKATDPAVLLFLSHSFAVFLLLCIWIAEVAISASYKKAGLSGIIKLK